MEHQESNTLQALPFPIPDYRFDQKNIMFARPCWDDKWKVLKKKSKEVKFNKKPGFHKMDYALRNAAFSLFSQLGSSTDAGLNSWDGVHEQIRLHGATGSPVNRTSEEMSQIIKKVARFVGADLVGICGVHPNWIYSHEFNNKTEKYRPIEIPKGINSVIVMAVAMDYETLRSSPTCIGSASVGLGYSEMTFISYLMANFIRGLGYRAIPCGNDTALSVPMAMAAGLGEWSRMGLLVTKEFGPRVRLCKVLTDLSLTHDHYRPFGVVEFCKICKKCATNCPSQAISHDDLTTEGPTISNHSGALKWYTNPEKCYSFWRSNKVDCAECIRTCVFNKPKGILHDFVRAMIRRTSLFNGLFLWGDDVIGYDKPWPADKFWKSP